MLAAQAQWHPRFADRMTGMQASEIRELLSVIDRPEIVSFAGGVPDPDLFPLDDVRAVYKEVLANDGMLQRGLQYSASEGDPDLRDWIAARMRAQGVACDVENILITNGSQQALEFFGTLFISPRDRVVVADPTYLGALQAFAQNQPHYETFSVTRDGIRVSEGATGDDGRRTAMLYVVPDFANPTGETLDHQARLDLLDVAQSRDTVILEDSPYEMLRFDGAPEPSIQALDVERTGSINRSRVAYCGSFSKVFTPGLRIGWICASREIISALVLIKQAADLSGSAINQRVTLGLARRCFDAQVERARRHYRTRRDVMLQALPSVLPEGSRWNRPDGGMFIWVELPDRYDNKALLQKAVRDFGVAYVPGAAFFSVGSGHNTMRLSYSLPGPSEIGDGIERLGRCLSTAPGA